MKLVYNPMIYEIEWIIKLALYNIYGIRENEIGKLYGNKGESRLSIERRLVPIKLGNLIASTYKLQYLLGMRDKESNVCGEEALRRSDMAVELGEGNISADNFFGKKV